MWYLGYLTRGRTCTPLIGRQTVNHWTTREVPRDKALLKQKGCVRVCACVHVCELFSCVRLFVTPWAVARQASPSTGFSRQEYWSGVPFLSPEDLPDPRSHPGLPYFRQILCRLSHPGSLAYSSLHLDQGLLPPWSCTRSHSSCIPSLCLSIYPCYPGAVLPSLHQPTSWLFFSLASRLAKGSSVAQTSCVILDPPL